MFVCNKDDVASSGVRESVCVGWEDGGWGGRARGWRVERGIVAVISPLFSVITVTNLVTVKPHMQVMISLLFRYSLHANTMLSDI